MRVIEKDGEPWFVAKDVADIFEIQNIRQNMDDFDDDEKGVCNIYTPGGMQSMTVINEPGLYKLAFKSRKPEAKKFVRWVTHEVLPSIRRDYMNDKALRGYSLGEAELNSKGENHE